ncbi:unnamed protein product, partial [Closterium sp. NIES-64]
MLQFFTPNPPLTPLHPCSEHPFQVCEAGEAGRAVVATRQIAEGEVVLATAPVVSHPALQHVGKVCYLCLGPLAAKQEHHTHSDGGGRGDEQGDYNERLFCSKACADVAWHDFYAVESTADWSDLHQHCRTNSLRFPLVAKRLACMVLAGTASANVLQPLCHVAETGNSAAIPAVWQQEHAYIYSALSSLLTTAQAAGQGTVRSLSFFTAHWYASLLARLHLNAFRLAPLLSVTTTAAAADHSLFDSTMPDGILLSSAALFRAASAAVTGDEAVGTGVYLLPSLFNHDCDPDLDISWPTDATAVLRARRDIEA